MIQIKLLNENITLPKYSTVGSAGVDLRACVQYPTIIKPNETFKIPTGIAVYISDPKIVGMIVPRSGLGINFRLILANTVGIIDSDYQGEIIVALYNAGESEFVVEFGDRIAQLIFMPVIQVDFETVQEFSEQSKRNIQGFGHTGLK